MDKITLLYTELAQTKYHNYLALLSMLSSKGMPVKGKYIPYDICHGYKYTVEDDDINSCFIISWNKIKQPTDTKQPEPTE